MNDDIDSIKTGLSTDDPAEFPARMDALFEWLRTTRDPWRNQRAVEALLDVACSRERNLAVRFIAIEGLHEIAGKVPEELNRLLDICRKEEDPLRLRWAATDLLQALNPRLAEGLIYKKELFDRTVDPDNPPPKLDVNKELSLIAEKQQHELNYYPLIALLIVCGIMGTIYAYDTRYFIPIIACWVVLAVGFISWLVIWGRRCPKCKRFFARVKMDAVHGYDGPSMPIGSLGPGGSPVQTRQRVTVYEVRCRYCQHPWVILR